MLREMTWRHWAVILGLLTIDLVAGLFYSESSGVAEEWMIRIGTTAGSFAPLVLVGVYTFANKKWWWNTLGSALVIVTLGVTLICLPLAYTFIFDNGLLTPSYWAWLEVSGHITLAAAILYLSWIFLRIHRDPPDAEA